MNGTWPQGGRRIVNNGSAPCSRRWYQVPGPGCIMQRSEAENNNSWRDERLIHALTVINSGVVRQRCLHQIGVVLEIGIVLGTIVSASWICQLKIRTRCTSYLCVRVRTRILSNTAPPTAREYQPLSRLHTKPIFKMVWNIEVGLRVVAVISWVWKEGARECAREKRLVMCPFDRLQKSVKIKHHICTHAPHGFGRGA